MYQPHCQISQSNESYITVYIYAWPYKVFPHINRPMVLCWYHLMACGDVLKWLSGLGVSYHINYVVKLNQPQWHALYTLPSRIYAKSLENRLKKQQLIYTML